MLIYLVVCKLADIKKRVVLAVLVSGIVDILSIVADFTPEDVLADILAGLLWHLLARF